MHPASGLSYGNEFPLREERSPDRGGCWRTLTYRSITDPPRIRATRVFELDFTRGSGAGKNGARCGGAQGAADQATLLGALDEGVRAGGGRFERWKSASNETASRLASGSTRWVSVLVTKAFRKP